MARARTGLLCLLVSTAICGAVGWWAVPRLLDRGAPASGVRYVGPSLRQLLRTRRAEAAGTAEPEWSLEMPRRDAQVLFPLHHAHNEYDPLCYIRYPAHYDAPRGQAEYPRGRYPVLTNGLGIREVHDPLPHRPDLRLLAAGDSHTDGVCRNRESWPNVLEARLRQAHPELEIEVLNAGKGGHSFYNYLGVLRRLLYLEPHALVIGVYGGNDFYEVLPMHRYFYRRMGPPSPEDHHASMLDAAKVESSGLSQGLCSYKYFHTHPDEIHVALRASQEVMERIRDLCREHGIELVVVYIPALPEVRWQDEAEVLEEVRTRLGLSHEDVELGTRMADRFLSRLREDGYRVVDMRDAMRASKRRCYWSSDHHINVHAQALIARALLEPVELLLE